MALYILLLGTNEKKKGSSFDLIYIFHRKNCVTIQHIKPKSPTPSFFFILRKCIMRSMNIALQVVMLRRRGSISLKHECVGLGTDSSLHSE